MVVDPRTRRIVTMVFVVAVVSGCAGGATPTPPPSPPSPTAPTAAPSVLPAASTPPSPSASPSQATAATPSTPTQVVSPFHDSVVGCSIGAVQVAESNLGQLTALTDCRDPVRPTKRVLGGGFVTTDPCGQAVLDSKCGRIYVFQDSGLRFSTCDQQTAISAAGCLTDGTMAWDNTCPGGVATIVTPTASITLNGTWISATYMPDRQLSLFTVLEGDAVATAVDATGVPSGVPQDIPRDSFWFTGPAGGEPANVGGLEAGATHPLEQFGPVIAELQLESWMAAVKTRAAADGVKTELPAKPVINLRARGGPFDDQFVQDALLLSTEWPVVIRELFGDGETTLFALIGDRAPSNLSFWSKDFIVAKGLIEDRKLGGTSVVLIADDVGRLDALGKNFVPALQEINLNVEFVILPPDDAARLYEERGSRGEPTIWLSSR